MCSPHFLVCEFYFHTFSWHQKRSSGVGNELTCNYADYGQLWFCTGGLLLDHREFPFDIRKWIFKVLFESLFKKKVDRVILIPLGIYKGSIGFKEKFALLFSSLWVVHFCVCVCPSSLMFVCLVGRIQFWVWKKNT